MAWTVFANSNYASTPPLAPGDGNVWNFTTFGTPGDWFFDLFITDPVTAAQTVLGYHSTNDTFTLSDLISDGTNVWCYYASDYPRGLADEWNIATKAHTSYVAGTMNNWVDTAVYLGGASALLLGEDFPSDHAEGNIVHPLNAISSGLDYGSGWAWTRAVLIGSTVWAGRSGSSTLYSVNTSTLALTPHALADTLAGEQAQLGYDGSNLYLPTTSGIRIYGGALFGSGTHFIACYYSANLAKVFAVDNTAKTWSMPAGGGTLTYEGSLSVAGGWGHIDGFGGFGDGPGATLFATAQSEVPDGAAYLFKYGQGGQLVMLP